MSLLRSLIRFSYRPREEMSLLMSSGVSWFVTLVLLVVTSSLTFVVPEIRRILVAGESLNQLSAIVVFGFILFTVTITLVGAMLTKYLVRKMYRINANYLLTVVISVWSVAVPYVVIEILLAIWSASMLAFSLQGADDVIQVISQTIVVFYTLAISAMAYQRLTGLTLRQVFNVYIINIVILMIGMAVLAVLFPAAFTMLFG